MNCPVCGTKVTFALVVPDDDGIEVLPASSSRSKWQAAEDAALLREATTVDYQGRDE